MTAKDHNHEVQEIITKAVAEKIDAILNGKISRQETGFVLIVFGPEFLKGQLFGAATVETPEMIEVIKCFVDNVEKEKIPLGELN